MYFQDLTKHVYLGQGQDSDTSLLNVGWLDTDHEFTQGPVPKEVLQRILGLCFQPVNQTRGFHQSPFLKPATLGYEIEYNGQKMLLGSAEIRVSGRNGKSYAAPNLIYHYMKDCAYLPPQEFLEALMTNSMR